MYIYISFRTHQNNNNNNNALASLPSIDDFSEPTPPPPPPQPPHPLPQNNLPDSENRVYLMSDESTSSSSDSDSDSDLDITVVQKPQQTNGHATANGTRPNLIPEHILDEDLCLSESGSDSD